MILGIGQLVTAYVVLAALLALLIVFSSLSWFKKAALIVLTSASYLILYFSFPPQLGWPSTDKPPKRFGLVALYAQEPDKITGARGNIYFWAVDKKTDSPVPRGYQVDYTPELHATVKDVRAKLNRNVPQIGESDGTEKPDLSKIGNPNDDRLGTKSSKNTVKFYDAGPTAPPSKGDMPAPTSDTDASHPAMPEPSPAAAPAAAPTTPAPATP
jgi:hypothetical protein